MLALVAAVLLASSPFTPVPGFEGRLVHALAGGRDQLFVVSRGPDGVQRLDLLALPGLGREDVTARLRSGTASIQELAWDETQAELWVFNSSDSGADCYSSALEIKRRYLGSWPHPEPFLVRRQALLDQAERAAAKDAVGSGTSLWVVAAAGKTGFAGASNGGAYLIDRGRTRRVLAPAALSGGVRSLAVGACAVWLSDGRGLVALDARSGRRRRMVNQSSRQSIIEVGAASAIVFIASEDGGLAMAPEASLLKDVKCPRH